LLDRVEEAVLLVLLPFLDIESDLLSWSSSEQSALSGAIGANTTGKAEGRFLSAEI
jgi:hypothetical protein